MGNKHIIGGIEAPINIKCTAERAYIIYCNNS